MKFFFCIALMVLALGVYADAFGMWKGGCKTDDDCKETQCCQKQFGSNRGQCLRRPQEGENCVPDNKFNKMFQQGSCPCAQGQECARDKNSKYSGMSYAMPPVCRVTPKTTEGEQPVTAQSDVAE